MALLMPDINLRRKRKSFENFWLRAIGGENNDTTNSEHIQAQSAKSPLSSRRRPRPLKEATVLEHRIERAASTHMLPKYDAAVVKEQPPSHKQRHPVAVLVKTPPTSSSSLSRSSRAPPRSRPRYVQRVPGPTLGHVLNCIRRNEGDVSELDFSNLSSRNKRLEPYGGVLVARVLTTNSTVTRLVIRDHAIGDRGAMAIADMLRHNATLEFIDLYSNDISDDGAEALAKALYGHASLQHLALWSNAITNRGARAFAEALKCNSTLTYLGLVHNRITADGAQALLDALEVNTHLETLNLATNRVPHAITSQIRITLARNRVDAPRVQATMAEGAVRQWLDELRIQNNNTVDHGEMSGLRSCSEVDESEASGFLSCSDADDEDSDSVWI